MALDWNGKTKWLKKKMGAEDEFRATQKRKSNPRRKVKRKQIKKSNQAKDRAEQLTRDATPQEIVLKELFDYEAISYQFQKIIYVNGSYCIADFYFPKIHLVLEVDGYYHFTPEGKAKDKIRNRNLRQLGYRVIHVINSEVDHDFMSVYDRFVGLGILPIK
jgi:very-short-patch-repair endonuclease